MSELIQRAKKIVVTGGAGFLGRHVVAELVKRGAKKEAILVPRSSQSDIRQAQVCRELAKGADLVLHLAAKVGGIGYNQKFPGELFYDNATMGIHMIEACRLEGVKKIVVAGTICAYPRYTPVPFKEDDLWNGYPEETNAPYGIAKKALLVMLQAYRQQYGLNGVFALPVNLYGPWDNFHLENSHVIPALIRKFVEAHEGKKSEVVLWGDGSPTREFLFVDDAARGLVMAAESLDTSDPVNLGSAEEISIRDLAETIQKETGLSRKDRLGYFAPKWAGKAQARRFQSGKAFRLPVAGWFSGWTEANYQMVEREPYGLGILYRIRRDSPTEIVQCLECFRCKIRPCQVSAFS